MELVTTAKEVPMSESFFQWLTSNNTKLIKQYETNEHTAYNPLDDNSQSAFARFCQNQWRQHQVSSLLVK